MCDYSLHNQVTREAEAGDELVSSAFPKTHTRGFRLVGDNPNCATCLKPGTEVAFDAPVRYSTLWWGFMFTRARVATFRQIDTDRAADHHDALEFSNGKIVKLNDLRPGQVARVVQLPINEVERAVSEVREALLNAPRPGSPVTT